MSGGLGFRNFFSLLGIMQHVAIAMPYLASAISY